MSVPQLGDDRDGVQPGIFCEGCRDDLERFGKGLEAVGFHALEGLAVLGEKARDVDLGGAAADDESSESGRGGGEGGRMGGMGDEEE
jgi:hypothetical protein